MTKPIPPIDGAQRPVPPRSGLKAPFPWFGGKSRAAHLVWPRFGDVPNYVEPFAGSLAVLLRRPTVPGNEIVNDLDCYVSNAWRAMASAPDEVASYCDWPVNEADLHARHRWLHGRIEFRQRMENDPDYFDARIAGYWIWGLSCWIGDNFCRPKDQSSLTKIAGHENGVFSRKIPYISKPGGMGVARKVVPSENIPHKQPSTQRRRGRGCQAPEQLTWRKRPELESDKGGFQRIPGGGDDHQRSQKANLQDWFEQLSARLRYVKVCCGGWERVCTKAATYGQGLTAVLLDPPYDPDLICRQIGNAWRGRQTAVTQRRQETKRILKRNGFGLVRRVCGRRRIRS